jgi:hypothetical protein
MLVCDLCLLNPGVLVVSGLSEVLGTLGQILISFLVHMHSRLRSLRQGQVHVGPITWEVLPHILLPIVSFGYRIYSEFTEFRFQNFLEIIKNKSFSKIKNKVASQGPHFSPAKMFRNCQRRLAPHLYIKNMWLILL